MTEAYLCEGVRTPIGRYAGSLSAVRPDDMLGGVIRKLVASVPQLDPTAIDDVIVGCANQAGEDNRNVARMGLLIGGLPDSVPGATVNRLCGSGLDAAKADEIMDAGLRAEVKALAFAQVVLSDTKVPRTYELEVTPENELGLPDLREVGLGEPLRLPEAP